MELNHYLIKEENIYLENKLKSIELVDLEDIIGQYVKKIMSLEVLNKTLIVDLSQFDIDLSVSGEHIRSLFILEFDGIYKLWCVIKSTYSNLFNSSDEYFLNIQEAIEDILDSMDFDVLFATEIETLNKHS